MPRKTKLTPELQSTICRLVAGGSPLPAACGGAHISWNTVKDWMALGRTGKAPYAAFVEAVDMAKNQWIAGSSMRITAAGRKDWKAAAWLLERRVKGFAPPTTRIDLEVKSAEWLRSVLSQVRSRAVSGEFEHLSKEAVDELLAVLAGKQ